MNPALAPVFDRMVTRHFGPLARSHGLSLHELRSGIYEIAGKRFGLRIRYGTGHRNDFLITVFPVSERPSDLDDLKGEFGLGILAEFNGATFQGPEIQTEKDAEAAFELAAASAKSYALPYLIGEKDNIDDIRQFVEQKIQRSGIRGKKYHFPPNVREEWVLPEQPEGRKGSK